MNNTNPKPNNMNNMNNMNEVNKIGETITKIYQKTSYLEKYGGSVFFTSIIFGGYAIYKARLNILNNVEPIKNEWANKRCSPGIIPFAGLINTPPDKSAFLFTANNFSFCLYKILSTIVKAFITPIYMVVSVYELAVRAMILSVKNVKLFLQKIQEFINELFEMLAAFIMKLVAPIKNMMYTFIDMISKMGGIMQAVVFALYSTYMAFKAIVAGIIMNLVIVTIAVCLLIVILWLIPFVGWAAAAVKTIKVSLFIATVLSIFIHFSRTIFGISTGAVLPLVPACFDKDTKIVMKGGEKKRIIDIKVGDILEDDSNVTGVIKHSLGRQKVYKLDGALVTENHTVVLDLDDDCGDIRDINEKHIPVREHPLSELVENYNDEYIYCINTTSKRIRVNNTIYTDWDDLDEMDMVEIRSKYKNNGSQNLEDKISHSSIHKYLDGGFAKDTLIQLEDGRSIPIVDVQINDVLIGGECVTGLVEIDGSNLGSQYSYTLVDDSDNPVIIRGGPNLLVYDDENLGIMQTLDINGELIKNEDKLYHLITNKRTMSVNGIKFLDYNSCVEIYLEEDRTSLIYSLL